MIERPAIALVPTHPARGRLAAARPKPWPLLALALALPLVFVVPELQAAGDETPQAAGDEAPASASHEASAPGEQKVAGRAVDRLERWTGDFDEMVERHQVRVLVSFSKTFYFLDQGAQLGVSYELVKAFEKRINEQLGKKTVRVHTVFIPVSRDKLISGLVDGLGDIAVANLTITPERLEQVDFSAPTMRDVSEIVVTGPAAPELAGVEDLSGQTIHVRPSSSYYESLVALNERFRAEGRPEIELVPADEFLEDEDLLEMVNAGMLPMVVVDRHKAELWAKVFDDIVARTDIAVRTGGELGWALRKDSPELRKVVDAFVAKNRKGTLLGNVLFNRYLKSTKYVRNVLDEAELKRFRATVDFFRKYADKYDFDWLITAALGYQESRLDQGVRSKAGAVGVMQVLPSTAKDPNVGIPDIHELESNIHAGIKYLNFLHNRYFQGDEMSRLNQWLMTFAAYNAGPAKVRKLRAEAVEMGLDPNVWFRNVELVAAKRIGRETVQYVSNIYKYYIVYKLLVEGDVRKQTARDSVQ